MKTNACSTRGFPVLVLLASGLLVLTLALPTSAGEFQLISAIAPSQGPAAGGNGDSGAPVISPDGRYVLFASTANNLLLTGTNTPMEVRVPPGLNVFLRDRTHGITSPVSVNLAGKGGGNGNSLPADISTNGRNAVFESSASDLVSGDTNNATDVFIRDLVSGITTLVSVSTNGGVGNGTSRSAAMTPDGRYVAFVSAANNLVPGDTNGIADIFVRDLWAGSTVLASVGATPTTAGGSSDAPDITPDGRYVVFYSTATNLVSGALNTGDIYVRDLVGGVTVRASTGAGEAVLVLQTTKAACYNHAISADGRFVAYEASPAPGSTTLYPGLILRYNLDTGSTDLVHTNAAIQTAAREDIHNLGMTPDGQRIAFVANTNRTDSSTTCILLWDAATGGSALVSGTPANQVPANSFCDWPRMDSSGRFVAFNSSASNLTTNALVGAYHLYLRDTQAGTTTLLDSGPDGVSSRIDPSTIPQLSVDGRFVAFECADGTLVPNDRNRDLDIFVRELATGAMDLVSARHPALPSFSPNGPSLLSLYSVSADGAYIAFASEADNLVNTDTNGSRDVFVRDTINGTNILVSINTNGFSGNALSFDPAVSADGRYVAFTSSASDLTAGDTNRAQDVFVRDLQTGALTLVSMNSSGTGPGNKDSCSPVVSAGGRYVLFRSQASNLASGFFSGTENLFLRDMQVGTNYALTTTGLSCAAMTPDGRFVAYVNMSGTLKGSLYIWASASTSRVYTGTTGGISSVAISPNGNRVAYWINSQLFAGEWAANTNWVISASAAGSPPSLRFSGDSRFLAYVTRVSNTNQVCLYDFQTRANLLVSRSYNSGSEAYGHSDWPDVSADGRFVAYRSAAADIVPGDTNSLPDIFLFDRQTGATTLLSASRFGNRAADNRSGFPVFSASGQTLLFQSWAADLGGTDLNHSSDVFAYSLYSSGEIPLFYATLVPGDQGPWILWPTVSGKSYRVQFKNRLEDSDWQELGSSVTLLGNQGSCRDLTPAAGQRFYRIVAF